MPRYVGVYVHVDDGNTHVNIGEYSNGSEAFDALYEEDHSVDWFILPEEQARRLRDRLDAVLGNS